MGCIDSSKSCCIPGRINEFLHTRPTIESGETDLHKMKGAIEFRNVSYSYPNSGVKAVQQLSFKIMPGESMAIIGRTGSGKSTIANLLMRLVDPDSGQVLIDGKDLREVNLGSYRSQTGYVAQEVFLFSDTISNNIAFGLTDEILGTDRKHKIEKAAADAVIFDNIQEFPEKFETRVGERGITLSGGQKQRISIARAIIRNPSILIFDDCLSAVDTRTEEKILDNLERIMAGKTTFIISHRISSVRQAGKILVIDEGRVVESGSHHELIAKMVCMHSCLKNSLWNRKLTKCYYLLIN
jgi:ATP-binding cassette subfamily B protein